MPSKKRSTPFSEKNITIHGDVKDSAVIIGDNNTVNQTFVQKVINIFRGDTEQQRAQRNRKDMLELVKSIWIKGVLEKSLHGEILIELGIEEKPGAVERPWDMLMQMPDQPSRALPPGTPIVQVFDEMNGALLILGEPGSGKTISLLELARDTLARAEQDATPPIPVVFNLSSWTNPGQSLADWLVAELGTKYYVSKKLAEGWVLHDELLLLLDGLDEIKLENREAAIRGINDFRQTHGSMKLAVCCRIADYEALRVRLQLWGAVLLQPLTPQQIDEYFNHTGAELSSVRQILQSDAALQELVRQPLMLSILTLAYRGLPAEALAGEQDDTLEGRRKHLFDTYIQQMFARPARTPNLLYTPDQTKGWLAWLAQRMVEREQSIFSLERMDRSWLENRPQEYLHKMAVMLGIGLPIGLLIWMVGGLMGGLVGALTGKLVYGLLFGLRWAFLGGLLLGLGSGLVWMQSRYERPVELLSWSWKKAWNGPEGWSDGWLVGGLLSGLLFGLAGAVISGKLFGLRGGLIGGLLAGLAGGLAAGLAGGLIKTEMETRIVPNQGIQQSIKNIVLGGRIYALAGALMLGPIFGLFGGLAAIMLPDTLLSGLSGGLAFGLAGVFVGGVMGGLLGGLKNGGIAVISHYTLRFLLFRQDYVPRYYVRFLDYCAERVFLRRVGGGYIFAHRLLMEHFAGMLNKHKE